MWRTSMVAWLAACDAGVIGSAQHDAHDDGVIGDAIKSDSRPDDAPGGTGEPVELTGMTLYHNQVRASVDITGVTSGVLPYMQWDPNLATLAATWVAQCVDANTDGLVDHSSGASRTNAAGYGYVGENIYAGTGNITAHDAIFGTFGWQTEGAYYSYATDTCSGSPSGSCGHYTQVVWRDSLHVGCALTDCPGLTYRHTILCNYGAGGNSGGKPY